MGLGTDNFPALPANPKPAIALPAEVLAGLIDRTAFAVAQDESRYTLCGALLLVKPESVAMVATDGHRLPLAERRHSVPGVNAEMRILIPNKALGELRRLLRGKRGRGERRYREER